MFPFRFFKENKAVLPTLLAIKSPTPGQNIRTMIHFRYNLFPRSIISYMSTQKSLRNSNQLFKSFVKFSSGTIKQPNKTVGYWLLGCSGMVVVAVILGGVTRLTESGLSMVTWRLMGEKVPKTQNDWLIEFKKYQEYPEYKLLKRDITLNEFQRIWWMEYIHRSWGRLIGAAFYLPAAYFWVRGYLPSAYKKRVVAFGGLIAMQGLMGWYMVKSGLEDRFHKETDIPRVSQYRLASHLGLAFLLYIGTLYSALDILLPSSINTVGTSVRKLRKMTHFSKGLIFLTAISGAFVAGMDAGLLYNSFPKMGERWIPEEIFTLSPILKNFTENPVTVQFQHRLLGTTTWLAICALWVLSYRTPLPRRTRLAINLLTCMGFLQVSLGISTLLHYVPTSLAVIHQSGSLALMSLAIWVTRELKFLKHIAK